MGTGILVFGLLLLNNAPELQTKCFCYFIIGVGIFILNVEEDK